MHEGIRGRWAFFVGFGAQGAEGDLKPQMFKPGFGAQGAEGDLKPQMFKPGDGRDTNEGDHAAAWAMTHNPFPGPQPFRAADRAHFYGREDLSRRLEGAILAHRAVVVHGPSGSGKSSMIQASVLPNLSDAEDVRIVFLDGWPPGEDPTSWLAAAMYTELKYGALPADLAPREAVVSSLKRAVRGSSRLLVICIDQLEQLLYPDRDVAKTEAFFDCLNDILDLPLRTLRVVMSLREDYLGVFRDRLRDHRRVLGQGFRVGPLTVAELAESMCKTALSGTPPQNWSLEEMRSAMMQARVPGQAETDDAEVQAAYGQIVCRALFQDRASPTSIRATKGVRTEAILRKYLEETLSELGPLRESAETLLEEQLVSGQGGRTLRTEKELESHFAKNDLQVILRVLEGAAILRAASHQGSRYFELGHDWLARRVFERRQVREQEKERRRIEAERENERRKLEAEQAAALEKARRERRFWIVITAGCLVFVAGAIISSFWVYQEKREAENAREEANRAARIAKRREIDAYDASILAGVRELTARGKVTWAMKLLPEVQMPAIRRGWVGLASDLLASNALVSTLEGHSSSLMSASFSPDSHFVLTSSLDGSARIWPIDGKTPPVVLSGHSEAISYAQWSHDGKYILSASLDGTVRVVEANGKTTSILSAADKAPVYYAEFSPDDERIVTASRDGFVRIHPIHGKTPPIAIQGSKKAISCVRFHPRDARLFFSTEDAVVASWDGQEQSNPVIIDKHEAPVVYLALSGDGRYLASASMDGLAKIWDIQGEKAQLKTTVKHDGAVHYVAFDSESKRLATASADRLVRVVDLETNEPPFIHPGHTHGILQLAFHPRLPFLATASQDGTARIFRMQSEASFVLRGHDATVRSIAWNSTGSMLVTAAGDGTDRSPDETARIWSPGSLERISYGVQGEALFHSVDTNMQTMRIAAVHGDATVRVFERANGNKPIASFPSPNGWVASVSFAPDGESVATGSFDKIVRVFRLNKPNEPLELSGHSAEVRFVRFSPDGKRILSGGDDSKAMIFALDGKQPPITLSGHSDWLTDGAWSNDGKHVATASYDHTARIWNSDGSGTFTELVGHTGEILAIKYFPDGERILTASADQTARIWQSGKEIRILRHDGVVLTIAISPDGKYVCTYAADDLIRIWRTDSAEAPIELESPIPVKILAFLENSREVVAIDDEGATHPWMIDINLLRERIVKANADCVPATMRMLYLNESAADAAAKFAACKQNPHVLKPLPEIAGDDEATAKMGSLFSEGIKLPKLRELGSDMVRAKLVVFPTDAEVEIDNIPTPRRQGVIEFVGKRGQTRKVMVQRGAKHHTFDVTIDANGSSPSKIDLNDHFVTPASVRPGPGSPNKPTNTKVEGWLPNGME